MAKKRIVATALSFLLASAPSVVTGGEILLYPGQSYESDDETVICIDRRQTEPVVLRECQIWDDFNRKCLFELSRYLLEGLECREECQHWDSFNARCDYATSCSYQASSRQFVQTVCDEFDAFSHKCVRQKERLLRSSGRDRDGGR